jgi:hypothetical protein
VDRARNSGRDVGEVAAGDELVLFFDGSKSDDATGLIGCRISDGHLIQLGVWQRPPVGRDGHDGWIVNRHEVDQHVRQVFELHDVLGFWADPSHALDDVDGEGFWDAILDGWHRDFGEQIDRDLWAVKSGDGAHAVMWDMSSERRVKQFTRAAGRMLDDLESGNVTLDGSAALRQHLKNARRAPNKWGVSIRKKHRESAAKVDLAVCAIGARMLRNIVLNQKSQRRRKRPGKAW